MKPSAFSVFFSRCTSSRVIVASVVFGGLAPTIKAASAIWNGNTDALWATEANWSVSPVPGTGDTATFNNAGNDNTTLDLGAGVTIGNILFDTHSAAAYTIGSSAIGSQTLTLDNTAAITVNSAVTNGQTFNSAITLGTAAVGTATITNNSTTAGLTFNGNITGGTGGTAGIKTLAVTGAGNTTLNGSISRGGATNLLLTKSGVGTLYLNATTTLRGGFNANVLSLAGGSIQLGNTAVLNITTSDAAFRASLNGSGTISGGSINLSAGTTSTGTLTIDSIVTSLAGTIGGGTSNKTVLTNASNSFNQSIRIQNGTLEVSSVGALGTGSSIAFGTANFGGGTLIHTGGSGTLNMAIIQGVNATTTGTITQSGTGVLNITGAVTNQNTFNLTLNGSTSGTGELSGNISISSGSFTKSGTGTWTLSGNNSYTGNTTISDGTLFINGDQSLATGAVSVNGTSTLGGNGTLGGNVTVAAAAKLSPGASVGTLSILGNLNISATAGGAGTLNYELGSIAASDKIAVTGTLTIGTGTLGFSDFAFSPLGGLQNGTYKLITSGGINGTLDATDLSGPVGAGTGTLQITGNDLELVITGLGGATGYNLWASTNAPSGTSGDDFDADGVSNGVEYVLGGSKDTNDLGKLPQVSSSGGNMIFTFQRDQDSIDGSTSVVIEVGTDLATWNTASSPYLVPTAAATNVPGVSVVKDSPAPGIDTVTLSVPQAPDARKFARIKVTTSQ